MGSSSARSTSGGASAPPTCEVVSGRDILDIGVWCTLPRIGPASRQNGLGPGCRGPPPTIRRVAVLIASNLRKEHSGTPLFDGVSFTVNRRDRIALSGANGAGKTTL